MKTSNKLYLATAGFLACVALGLGIRSQLASAPRTSAPPAQEARGDQRAGQGSGPRSLGSLATHVPEPAAEAQPLRATPGQRFRYRMSASWRAELRVADDATSAAQVSWKVAKTPAEEVTVAAEGLLETLVLAEDDDGYVVRFQLRDPRITGRAGARSVIDPEPFRSPGFVRISRDGRVTGFAFDPSTAARPQRFLAALIASSHQFVVRDEGEPWVVRGLRDGADSFSARFGWSSPRMLRASGLERVLQRTVLSYGEASLQRVEESAAEAGFTGGWIGHVEARERRVGQVGPLSTRTRFELRLDLAEADTTAVTAADLPQPGAAWLRTLPEPPSHPQDEQPREARFTGDPIGHLDDLMSSITALDREGNLWTPQGWDAWDGLAELIRERAAEVLPVLLERVRSGQMDVNTRNWMIASLGRAGGQGSIAAVDALAEIVNNTLLAEEVRLSALLAAHEVGRNATPALLDAATDLLLQGDVLSPDSSLPSAAGLLTGTLAEAGELPLEDALLDLVREDAFRREEPATYFEALANTSRPEMLDQTLPYLEDPDPRVRQAAAEALRRYDDLRAREALVRMAQTDLSSDVRQGAVGAMGELIPTPDLARALSAISVNDADLGVRSQALQSLGAYTQQGSNEAAAAVRRAAESDPAPELRDVARQILADLAGEQGGGEV